MLKIATWNVNSLRVRLPQLLEWLKLQQADIVALQEIKVVDELFPLAEINAAGYHCAFAGQKTYNGVALLSRVQGSQIQTDFPHYTDPQRRILAVSYGDLRVINVYIPNGSEVGSEKFAYKLEWLLHLKTLVADSLKTYPQVILLGDFNIAPQDEDVCDPEAYRDGILTHDTVRHSLQAIYELGMQDVFRCFPQPPKSYSWWDYRAAAFRRNLGVRIDLILANHPLAKTCTHCATDLVARGWERPSDHAPVVAQFEIDV